MLGLEIVQGGGGVAGEGEKAGEDGSDQLVRAIETVLLRCKTDLFPWCKCFSATVPHFSGVHSAEMLWGKILRTKVPGGLFGPNANKNAPHNQDERCSA